MPTKKVVKVLSIDGGGIRGIIPATVLAAIEHRTERPACELFDLIAGTSTGGIIALGVTVPAAEQPGARQPEVRQPPRWSAQQLADMYAADGGQIFHRGLVRTIETVDGLLVEKYAADGLEALLERCLGDAPLSQALTDVLITSYDIQAHEPFFFKSFSPGRRPTSAGEDATTGADASPPPDYPMRVVGRATSAAPTYFEPEHVIAPTPGASPPDYALVDGGTFANNPAMCAYAETLRNYPGMEVLLVSLGTGRLTESIPFERAKHWGLVQWAHPLLGVIMDGSSAAIDYQLDELLVPDQGHFRFQGVLEGVSDSLDDASASNIAGLRDLADKLVTENAARLDAVCERLTAE